MKKNINESSILIVLFDHANLGKLLMKKLIISSVICLISAITGPIMAAGNALAGKGKSAVCAACHGSDGNSASYMFPKLAGQNEGYIVKQLLDFKSGARKNTTMSSMVTSISADDMADLGAYYASNTVKLGTVPDKLLKSGQKIYRAGNRQSGLPACMSCHGPTGAGMPAAKWPALSGQSSKYVESQLRAFSSGKRNNDPNNMMSDIASRMTFDEIKAVSSYVTGLH